MDDLIQIFILTNLSLSQKYQQCMTVHSNKYLKEQSKWTENGAWDRRCEYREHCQLQAEPRVLEVLQLLGCAVTYWNYTLALPVTQSRHTFMVTNF